VLAGCFLARVVMAELETSLVVWVDDPTAVPLLLRAQVFPLVEQGLFVAGRPVVPGLRPTRALG